MSKAVLISIHPEWCELIAKGKKTIEVRKTRPKLDAPFKCYIYCTAGNLSYPVKNGMVCHNNGGKVVIGEFVCDGIFAVLSHPAIFARHPLFFQAAVDESCLTHGQLEEYAKGKDLCGWHISDLVIYDRPKELNEFQKPSDPNSFWYRDISINRPPQSWCYVEELTGGRRGQ